MRILAVDPGTRRTGLAISDREERLAVALPTIPAADDGLDGARIAEIAQAEGAEEVVVGLPINMDGSEGPRAAATRELIEDIRLASGLPVRGWDERLSTAEAESRLRGAGLDRREVSRGSDAASAIVILERYLEWRRKNPEPGAPPAGSMERRTP